MLRKRGSDSFIQVQRGGIGPCAWVLSRGIDLAKTEKTEDEDQTAVLSYKDNKKFSSWGFHHQIALRTQ